MSPLNVIRNTLSQKRWLILLVLFWMFVIRLPAVADAIETSTEHFEDIIKTLASLGDRSTGTSGNVAAAEFIKKQLVRFGYDRVESFGFSVPVRQHKESIAFIHDRQLSFPIYPMQTNAISPGAIPPQGINGPLIYIGSGHLDQLNGKPIDGAVVLMELSSGKNWLNAANLGAKALIYVDRGPTQKAFFEDKFELTPVNFPRFWLPYSTATEMLGKFDAPSDSIIASSVTLTSNIQWQAATTENIYSLVPGTDEKHRDELIIVEAFYDSTAFVFGKSPGADEACSAATLLALARELKKKPPARSVLWVASSGHAQTLSGIREMIWSLNARSKDIRRSKKLLKATLKKTQESLEVLESVSFNDLSNANLNEGLKEAL